METMRDIKRRISSIKNTQKITRAMKMVAAAKLRKSQDKAEAARPFFSKTRESLIGVARYTNEPTEHPLLKKRDGKRNLFIVINADRGLCGSYNIRVIDKARELFKDGAEISLMAVGRNARDYFNKRGYNVISEYIDLEDYPDYYFARMIGKEIISFFTGDMVDRVSLIYTHFHSAISQEVNELKLLPLEPPEEDNSYGSNTAEWRQREKSKQKKQVDYLYEPSPDEVFDAILPQYITNILYSALLEAKASEFGARMTAMDAATDNAGELIEKLTLSYNRARQAAITKEITEIVGGAEALK